MPRASRLLVVLVVLLLAVTPARAEQAPPPQAGQEPPARTGQEPPARTGQEPPVRTGTGVLLQERCQLYFEFLGRTGAGREDTFNEDPFGMGYCAGLVRGVVIAAQSFMPDRVCVPPGTTIAQTVHRVIQYLDRHPEESGELDVELVLRALEDRFRCP